MVLVDTNPVVLLFTLLELTVSRALAIVTFYKGCITFLQVQTAIITV